MAIATESVQGTVLLAGDLAGGGSSVSPQLTPTGVIPDTYKGATVTIDAKGRVLYARNISDFDVPCATNTQCGLVKVGNNLTATTDANGGTVISLKKASATEYGVVMLGDGFIGDNGTIHVYFDPATDTTLGVVKVPASSALNVVGGELRTSVATNSTDGFVRFTTGNGLALNDGVVSFTVGTIPTGSTSQRGLIQVGNNVTAANGLISLPSATTSVKGVIRGDATFTHTGGAISNTSISSTTVNGLIKVGTGLGVTADGTLSRGAAGGDATTTTKGLIQVSSSEPMLSATSGVLSVTNTAASTSVFGFARPGNNIVFDAATSTLSLASGDSVTNTAGVVRSANANRLKITNGVIDLGPTVLSKGANVFTAAQVVTPVQLEITTNTTINLSQGNVFFLNITSDSTITVSNLVSGGQYIFVITRPNASAVTFGSSFKFAGVSSLTAGNGAIDMITATAVGTDLVCRTEQNFL